MKTLQDLLDAIHYESVDPSNVTVWLDNDDVGFWVGDDKILELHPYELQIQALEALGLKPQAV